MINSAFKEYTPIYLFYVGESNPEEMPDLFNTTTNELQSWETPLCPVLFSLGWLFIQIEKQIAMTSRPLTTEIIVIHIVMLDSRKLLPRKHKHPPSKWSVPVKEPQRSYSYWWFGRVGRGRETSCCVSLCSHGGFLLLPQNTKSHLKPTKAEKWKDTRTKGKESSPWLYSNMIRAEATFKKCVGG